MGTMCCGTNLDNIQETPRQILRFYKGKKVQIYDFLSTQLTSLSTIKILKFQYIYKVFNI